MSSSLPSLSIRLNRLVELCGQGERLWDIGCDHGHAGLSAIARDQFKECFLVDPSDAVISKLQSTLDSHIPKAFKISLLHSKGADLIVPATDNTFLMAGFGGEQIKETLEALRPQLSARNRFVLSAHRDVFLLREWLFHSDWTLVSEEVVQDEGRGYEVIVVSSEIGGRRVSLYGEEQWTSTAGELLAQKLLDKLSIHQDPADRAFRDYLLTLQKRSN